MIDYKNLRKVVVKGLKEYLQCPVIRSNQNAEPPVYPYISYTITTLTSDNNGTYGEYDDGKARKPVTCTWSITALSDDNEESVTTANKAREYLDYVGTTYLNDNDVIVQSITSVTNRDNFLTTGYQYRNGFDCFFWCFDEIAIPEKEMIETVELGENVNKSLENRLDGIKQNEYGGNVKSDNEDVLTEQLEQRLNGVL